MAIIRKKELKNLTKEELEKKLKELEIELIKSKSQKTMHGATLKIKEIKKTIARILTHLNLSKKQVFYIIRLYILMGDLI